MSQNVTLNRLSGDSALDFAQLHQLRRQVRTRTAGSEQAETEVARQFEALFIAQLLKQARQTSEESGASLFDSPQTQMVQSLSDAQLARQLATPGMGLAQVLIAQMRRATSNVLGGDATVAKDGSTHAPRSVAPSSRLPTRLHTDATQATRPRDAASISELITKLSQKADAVVSVIREAPQHIHDFVARIAQAAHVAARESGVPAKLILSQAALESGWGRHEIRHADGSATHNVFGIKASPSWTGKVAHVATTEYQNGAPRRVTQAFRAYDSYDEAFADYARLMGGSARYSAVLQAATPEEAARRVQEVGYATDPAYADKLIGIMGYFQKMDVDAADHGPAAGHAAISRVSGLFFANRPQS